MPPLYAEYPQVDFTPRSLIALKPLFRPVYGSLWRWLTRRPHHWIVTLRFVANPSELKRRWESQWQGPGETT